MGEVEPRRVSDGAVDARPEIVFFDVGDTLLRVYPSWTGQYLEVCRRFRLDVEADALEAAFGRALQDGFWDVDGPFEATPEASHERVKAFDVRVMRLLGFDDFPDSFYRAIGEQFARPAAWSVFPETETTLESIARAGIRRAVISNWVWNLPELLGSLGLARHFEAIVTSARVGYQKPQREIFQWALRATGVPAERALHVGDSVAADVTGARGAGIRAVLLDRAGHASIDEIARPATASGALLDRAEHRDARPAAIAAGVPVITDLAALLPIVGLPAPGPA